MNTVQSHKLTKRLINHRPFRIALLILVICSVFLGFVIVPLEAMSTQENIHTYGEGLWWAVTTVTGVGYGDYTPVTPMGRVIGALLQIFGVVIFGLIIGIIGITMGKRQEEYYWFRLFERMDRLEDQMKELEKRNTYLVQRKEEKE